jgi:thiamine biosynthesis lipoprotein
MDAMQRLDLRAMNSDIELVSGAPDAARHLHRAERWLHAFEARFSRFVALSELSRLNASAGRRFVASPMLFELVRLALGLAERSGGLFDPTVLADLVSSGYDRSFDLVPPMRTAVPGASQRRFTWRDVSLDARSRRISMPEGCGIDLGGIGKGWAVDRLAAMLGTPCLVNGGGDVFAAGTPPDDDAWRVGVADPFHADRDLPVLRVVDRGVATSSSLKRRWRMGDAMLHHLIDPRTGRASDSDAVQVTVVATTTTEADYLAKVTLLRGATQGLEALNREPEVEGAIVRSDGSVLESEGLKAFL